MDSFSPSIITAYGYAHTAVSLLAMVAGAWGVIEAGRFSSQGKAGKSYYLLALLGILSGLTIFHHNGFGPGHGLSLLMLALLVTAYLSGRSGRWLWESVAASFLYFLLWFFATTETLTRLPSDRPFAGSPTDPALGPVRGVLLVATLALIYWQYRNIRRERSKG